MDEDDFDFTPSTGTSSKLASLFGNNPTGNSNSSFVYTAPKRPMKEASPIKVPLPEDKPSTKLEIIVTSVVQAYRLEQASYALQGKLGITIVGNQVSGVYQIILYRGSKEHVSKSRLSSESTVTVSSNLYISFYDEKQINWSVMFPSEDEYILFLKHFLIAKSNCVKDGQPKILWQDVITVPDPCQSSILNVECKVQGVAGDKVIPMDNAGFGSMQVNLQEPGNMPWVGRLAGCGISSRRLILLPNISSAPWTNTVPDKTSVLVDASVTPPASDAAEKPEETVLEDTSSSVVRDVDARDESTVDSSTEESSVKARGASIKEALASTHGHTKSHKANLISRMARMGQATLPVRNVPSDSEEESSVSVSPKPRSARTRLPAPTNTEPVMAPVVMYQPKAQDTWSQQQQLVRAQYPMVAVPVPGTPLTSPSSDTFGMYLCESRTQATELRMGLSKVADKVDLVLGKVQDLQRASSIPTSTTMAAATADPACVLSSVQSLVSDNQTLRLKVQDQSTKLEQQNERIFSLLELNHRYLEQTTNSKAKSGEIEEKLVSEMKARESRLEADLSESAEKLRLAMEDLSFLRNENTDLRREVENKQSILETNNAEQQKMEDLAGQLQDLHQQLTTAEDAKRSAMKQVEELQESLSCLVDDTAKQKEIILSREENVKKLTQEKEELTKQLENRQKNGADQMVKKLTQEKDELTKQIELTKKNGADELVKKLKQEKEALTKQLENTKKNGAEELVKKLTQEKEELRIELQKRETVQTSQGEDVVVDEVKKVMNVVYRALQTQFDASKEYTGNTVRQTLASTIRDVTLQFLEYTSQTEKKSVTEQENMSVSSEQTSSRQQTQLSTQEDEGSNAEETIRENSSDLTDDKGEAAAKERSTYDQSWRSSKPPPPPPLFDDDDDDDEDWLAC